MRSGAAPSIVRQRAAHSKRTITRGCCSNSRPPYWRFPKAKHVHFDTFVPRCLDKRAKQVRQLAAQALRGDATARHRLRVAYKRLRYALEFFASLFPGERLRNYHLSASGLQEMLGRLNDLAVASELIHEALPGEQGEDIRCWLDGQAEQLLPELGGLLNDFHQQAAPWKESLVVA